MAITGLYINKKDYDINTINSEKILNAYYILDDIEFYYEYDENNLEKTDMSLIIKVYRTQEDRNNRTNIINIIGYTTEINKNIDLSSLWNTQYIQIKQNLINEYTEYLKQTLNVDTLPDEYQNMIIFTDV
tara:strand:+ start:50 stop:439 length:390 start_codon:yes stop_codon:yes gene_type:complete